MINYKIYIKNNIIYCERYRNDIYLNKIELHIYDKEATSELNSHIICEKLSEIIKQNYSKLILPIRMLCTVGEPVYISE